MNIKLIEHHRIKEYFFDSIYEYETRFRKVRLRISKFHESDDEFSVISIKIFKMSKIYWINMEKFGIFFKIMKLLKIDNLISSEETKFFTKDGIFKKWNIDVRSKRELREDCINSIISNGYSNKLIT